MKAIDRDCYNPLTMRSEHVLIMAAILLLSLSTVAQEVPQSMPCMAAGERIYQLGTDGVKPPLPPSAKRTKDAPKIRGQVSLQLVVSGEGNVCSATIIGASDNSSALEMANYIAQNWTFSPATKDGKPVAVTFRMNFGSRY